MRGKTKNPRTGKVDGRMDRKGVGDEKNHRLEAPEKMHDGESDAILDPSEGGEI